MAFLRSTLVPDVPATVAGGRVWLRAPQMSDYGSWAELRAMSRQHLVPWEPTWPRDDLTRAAFRRRLRHYYREARSDMGYAYLIFRSSDDALVGGIALSNVERGVSQSATLGYWLGAPYIRQGLMSDAVETLSVFAFTALRLHRLAAASQPDNVASIRVLERCGFVREGYLRGFLKINGMWRDHLLYSRLAKETEAGVT